MFRYVLQKLWLKVTMILAQSNYECDSIQVLPAIPCAFCLTFSKAETFSELTGPFPGHWSYVLCTSALLCPLHAKSIPRQKRESCKSDKKVESVCEEPVSANLSASMTPRPTPLRDPAASCLACGSAFQIHRNRNSFCPWRALPQGDALL